MGALAQGLLTLFTKLGPKVLARMSDVLSKTLGVILPKDANGLAMRLAALAKDNPIKLTLALNVIASFVPSLDVSLFETWLTSDDDTTVQIISELRQQIEQKAETRLGDGNADTVFGVDNGDFAKFQEVFEEYSEVYKLARAAIPSRKLLHSLLELSRLEPSAQNILADQYDKMGSVA